jgi:N-acetylglucosamine-6-sulfatase
MLNLLSTFLLQFQTHVNSKGYVTDILTDHSIKFIGQEREAPFLLFLAEKGLHPDLKQDKGGHVHKIDGGGFIPAKKDKGIYEDAVFNRRFNAYVTPYDKPALMRKIDELPTLGHRTATLEKIIRRRAEMLMSIDEGVGKIKKTLKEIGKLDDTIIILTSDHGYWYVEHGLGRERRLAYEEGIRIPMLVRYPPLVKKGTTYDQLALNIDLAPTLIELAGGKPDNSIDGKSWISFLTDPGYKNWRSSFLIEYYSDHVWPRTVNLGYKTIRTERYKYIQYNKLDGMNEFYDLEKDPYELTNQINNPNYKRTLNRMQNKLIQYLHD